MLAFAELKSSNRAAIILAGGDGMGLRDLTRFLTGAAIPKQFCAVIGEETLLEQTRNRAAMLIPVSDTAVVVNRAHQRFYAPLISDLPAANLAEEPCNRGTAPAILYGLRKIAHLSRNTIVSIFPSGQFIGDDGLFMSHVYSAIAAVEDAPERAVILGIESASAESSRRWIEPAQCVSGFRRSMFQVRRFWNDPAPELAARLWGEGCLCNSSVIVARATRLQAMLAQYAPGLFATFNAEFSSIGPQSEAAVVKSLYRKLPTVGFSEEVLTRCTADLSVERVDDLLWNDLNEPGRVLSTLRAIGHEPSWVKSYLCELPRSDRLASG